jgi:hypothetical protein
MDWINLAQDKDKWPVLENKGMNNDIYREPTRTQMIKQHSMTFVQTPTCFNALAHLLQRATMFQKHSFLNVVPP